MKSEMMNLIANQGADALHGPRGTQHTRCAFGLSSRRHEFLFCLDTQIRNARLTDAGLSFTRQRLTPSWVGKEKKDA